MPNSLFRFITKFRETTTTRNFANNKCFAKYETKLVSLETLCGHHVVNLFLCVMDCHAKFREVTICINYKVDWFGN
jgi:hypothetical protein